MNYELSQNTSYPLAEITLNQGETIKIERGCMVYHDGYVNLEGKMNANNSGIGGFVQAVGRSLTSGESFFVTSATGLRNDCKLGIAPAIPGGIYELKIGASQWRINDGAFLACDNNISYEMKKQSLGKAIFAGTGGLFVMETSGSGSMLINSFGDIKVMHLDGMNPLIVDNTHVVAWSASLQYELGAASGVVGFATGEGLVNKFTGKGTVLIQTRNIKSLADEIKKYIPSR